MKRLQAFRDPRRAALAAIGGALVIVLIIAGVVLLRSDVSVFGQGFSIGFVDMQRALNGHPRKAASERALQEFFQAKQREFAQQAKNLSPEQRQQLDRKLQQQIIEKRQELLGGLDKDIRAAIEQVAKQQGIGIVLERSVVLFGGTDLTDAIIKQIGGK